MVAGPAVPFQMHRPLYQGVARAPDSIAAFSLPVPWPAPTATATTVHVWARGTPEGQGCLAGAAVAPRIGGSLAAGMLLLAVASLPQRRRRARRTRIVRGAAEEPAEEAPPLASARDIDYTALRDLLAANDFKAADAETRRLLIVLAGKDAQKRGWIYFAEVRSIPEVDLATVDGLWVYFSKGKFGYAAQRKIWRQCREQFDKFAEKVSWFTDTWKNRNWPDEFIYDLDAPVGHLPLTNCIRGAQVLQELMCHPAFEKKKSSAQAAASDGTKRSPVNMLALPGGPRSVGTPRPFPLAGSSFGGWAAGGLGVAGCGKGHGGTRRAVAADPAAAGEPAIVEEPSSTAFVALAELEEHNVINENGFVLPAVPDGTKASAFMIFDSQHKPQYLGFSKDLRNTLRTFLCRRPELCYSYKCDHLTASDNAPLLELRAAWIKELGELPPGSRDPRQKALWESPVDGGAMSERAYKTVAEQKAKQVLRQLKDRGLKEVIEFKLDLIEQGKVDAVPSALSTDDLAAQLEVVSSKTSSVEKEVRGKKISFEIFYAGEFDTNGGWWFDIEVSADKQKSTHRVIVGKVFAATLGAQDPKEIVENAFAVLLARRVPRETDGLITSEVFPVKYFTAINVATQFPEFMELFGMSSDEFDWDSVQWNFKQVHDYSQDDKRTIPAGPMGGFFDPAALQ